MPTGILLQNIATFRIDPNRLRQPGLELVLVASPARAADGRATGAFDHVVSVEPFDDATVGDAVARLLAERGGDDVRLGTHDEYVLLLAARVRARFGLGGATEEQVRPFVDKLEMKRRLQAAGLRTPRHVRFDPRRYLADPPSFVDEVVTHLGLPVFAKPVDESGSVGTALLGDPGAVSAWCRQRADSTGGQVYELDEFVHGRLYHCDTVLEGGRAAHTAVSRYAYPCYDYLDGKICASIVLADEDPMAVRLRAFNADVLRALGDIPPDTATHHEVFHTDDDELVFLEIAARAPAAAIPPAYEHRFGFNIEEAHIALQLGTWRGTEPTPGPYAAWAFFPPRGGVVQALHEPALRSNYRLEWLTQVGERLADPTDIRVAAGRIVLWNDDLPTLQEDFASLDGFVAVEVAEPEATTPRSDGPGRRRSMRQLQADFVFTPEERAALTDRLLALDGKPYTELDTFLKSVRMLAESADVPERFSAWVAESMRRDHREHPIVVMQGCPIDDDLPVFDHANPVEDKYRIKTTFVAEGFLALYATLSGTEIIAHRTVNDGDYFHDIYPKASMFATQSQKTLGTLRLHRDFTNHFVSPDFVNTLTLRDTPDNEVWSTFVKNSEVLAAADPADLEILRQERFHTPFDDVSRMNDKVGLGRASDHAAVYGDNGVRVFEGRTRGLDDEAQEVLERFVDLLHAHKWYRVSQPGDSVAFSNNDVIHGREVGQIRDLEQLKCRWLMKTHNVYSLAAYEQYFEQDAYGVVRG